MPTNLPPAYFAAQERYRAAETPADKIACLQEMLSLIPKHKGTEHLVGDLRRRLSKLKSAAQTTRKVGKRESAFHIDRAGAGQVAVVGLANVGKSALVAALTGCPMEVADYPYTTREPAAAMMPLENIHIQLIDTPPLSREYVEPELPPLLRRADLLLVVVDVQTDPLQQMEETVALLQEYHIAPRHWRGRLADEGVVLVPFLVVANKADDQAGQELYDLFCQLLGEEWPMLPVSATTGRHLERLKRAVFDALQIVRVYTRAPGKEPDRESPFVLPRGSTVADLAGRIHHDFEQLAMARVWGSGVFDGQPVGRDHVLHDGDVVELHL
jgi:ribosome-interacting GTPase 1